MSEYIFNISGFDVNVRAESYEEAEYKALCILSDEHQKEYLDRDIINWEKN